MYHSTIRGMSRICHLRVSATCHTGISIPIIKPVNFWITPAPGVSLRAEFIRLGYDSVRLHRLRYMIHAVSRKSRITWNLRQDTRAIRYVVSLRSITSVVASNQHWLVFVCIYIYWPFLVCIFSSHLSIDFSLADHKIKTMDLAPR